MRHYVLSFTIVSLLSGAAFAQPAPAPDETPPPPTEAETDSDDTPPTPDYRRPSRQRTSIEAPENIIVTATKRETSLQKTPVAVTALTSESMERQQVVDLKKRHCAGSEPSDRRA